MKLAPDYKSRPSARKHRITIIRSVENNVNGFIETVENNIGTFWASVNPLSEKLRTQYKTVSVAASHTITIDGSLEVLESDKILFKDREFDILTIKDADENGRDKVIITQEIRPGQSK